MKKVNFKTVLILTFQLVIILVLVSYGTMYINKMATHSGITIKDNLQSVRYCSAMRKSLFKLRETPEKLMLRSDFERNLQAEIDNITEPGEKELVTKINDAYFKWLKYPQDSTYHDLLATIDTVNELNINEIEKRNGEAQDTASIASTTIILLGFFGGLIAVIFTFSFIGQLIIQKTNSATPVDNNGN